MSENLRKQESDTTEEKIISSERSLNGENETIQQLDSSAQFSLSVLEVSGSVNLLNSSTEQMKKLMNTTGSSTDALDRQIAVRCAREMREAIKAKLEIARFVLRAGAIKKGEGIKH